jgi:hypothetical protein
MDVDEPLVIKKVHNNASKLAIDIYGSQAHIINSIWGSIMNYVSSYAIDCVDIAKNTSSIRHDTINLKVSLIPVVEHTSMICHVRLYTFFILSFLIILVLMYPEGKK